MFFSGIEERSITAMLSNELQKNILWQFIDSDGSFRSQEADRTSRLYFPLCNESGILSSITPDLHGDIKANQNSFLMLPVTSGDLHNIKSSRNFWIYIEGIGAWSTTGVSSLQQAAKHNPQNSEKVTLEAGPLWHKVIRENSKLNIKSEIINFAPVSHDTVELMMITITNTGKSRLKITPTSAVPIFGRSADNVRDHRHVTSLLHRIHHHLAGVVVKPTMTFDERGHKINDVSYGVLGVAGESDLPIGAFPTVAEFIGEGGHLEAPKAVLQNLTPSPNEQGQHQGKAAIGALRFSTITLAPGQKAHYVLILGIADKEKDMDEWFKKFGSFSKAENAFKENKAYWSEHLNRLKFRTQDPVFNQWIRWVSLQPTLRKIFGCSFLPDFDYGRGGRGWRDLWQDCLALLLSSAKDAKSLLIQNFNGVRIDGSNATIIGASAVGGSAPGGKSGELIADRNNITRVWMDHGVWPYLTLELYIHQTGDFDILFENATYFRDKQMARARKKDFSWDESQGKVLKTKRGQVIEGSLLEHILVQHLVQFYNVGAHGHIRLENADWNDGLDMAYDKGESVAFTALYASNLNKLADLLSVIAQRKNLKKVLLAKELLILLDRVTGKKVKYDLVENKLKRLENYFESVQPHLSGIKRSIAITKLIQDLKEKSASLTQNIQKKEWISTRSGDLFYNGYYDNHGRRVEGDGAKNVHMMLAGQVFTIMGNVATSKQIPEIWKSAKKYLKDKEHGGFRLNTNFHEIRPDLGRAFSFAYGDKENGAFFSHMAVMFANALYQRGFVNEGYEVLDSLYQMAIRTEKSKIYPGIPEYFNSEGRGLYHYLTGSASWLILTQLTQVFGVRGYFGDLVLAPKFTARQFSQTKEISIHTQFADKPFEIIYRNPKKIGYEHYYITRVVLNGKELKELELNKKEVLISKDILLKFSRKSTNTIIVTLE